MDPAENTMTNLNSVPGGTTPDSGAPVDQNTGAGMDSLTMNAGQMAGGISTDNVSGMGGMQMGADSMGANPMDANSTGSMGANPMGSNPMGATNMGGASMGGGVPPMQGMASPSTSPMQQPGGQMSPGQMFQSGGMGPMGALGAIPGDYSSANSPLLGATDPITMPAPPKAPDPVEMELNAPFKAAGPVPGSIGSAISMPGDPNQVPNVAFNDPAFMAPNSSMMPKKKSWSSRLGMDGGKKMDKKTMIIIISIVAVIIVAAVFVVVTAL